MAAGRWPWPELVRAIGSNGERFVGGAVAERSNTRRWACLAVLFGAIALCGSDGRGQPPKAAPDLVRWSHNLKTEYKPIILYADDIATWTEGGRRVIVLKGKVWVELGVFHARMGEGVVWVDEENKRRAGVYRVVVYGENNINVEDGPKTLAGRRAVLDLSTRGEVKLKAYSSKVRQQPLPQDALYLRARAELFPPPAPAAVNPIQRVSFPEKPAATQSTNVTIQPVQNPRPPLPWPPPAGPGDAIQAPSPAAPPTVPIPPPPNANTPIAPPAPPVGPPPVQIRPATPPPPPQPPPEAPPRQISIVPRSSAPLQSQSFPMKNGETAVVVTSGVILTIRNADAKVGLIDIEADRLVFWTRGDPQKLVNRLRSPQGQTSRHMEFYLAGNVEIRQQSGKENRLLRADEVYYDVSRNVALALRADLQFNRPGVPYPVHLRAEELQQQSPSSFKVIRAEVFASQLPSDPGLKIVVAEATLDETKVPRKSIFGRQVVDRRTGQPLYETEQLFDGKDVLFKLEGVPIFYLPFLKGDANEPLGPLRNLSFNYNRIFGFQTFTSWNVYELLGIDKIPGTRWDLEADYLTQRGPALGMTYDYSGLSLFDIPNRYVGHFQAYGIDDTGKDILGGGRGELDHHPELRGRLLWRQDVQDLPYGFSVQAQLSALSDKNFLEQYYKREFDQDPNQETFIYVKQQNNNWAWTALGETRIRTWVSETEWLPRADGYLLGQSFFDLLTYNVHASAGYAQLKPTNEPPPPEDLTTRRDNTGRFDLWQELSLPFYLGPVKVVPYAVLDLTYYTEDLAGTDRGRVYGAGGLRASMPLSRLYPEIQSDLFNVNGIYHKIVLSGNYYNAKSDTPFTLLPQLDRINDDATDQAVRDIRPREPSLNASNGLFLATSPLFDPQTYAIRRLVENRIDTLDTIEVFEADIRQRWQTKRGYPGQQHVIDWMTLDLSASLFPHSNRDNFGETLSFLEYDWVWNIGDRTALVSSGWFDPIDKGPRVFTIGAFLGRPDRTSFFLGYRELYPINSQAVTASVTYVFSPKYALTASALYDFGTSQALSNSLVLTRIGSDLQVSLGFNYNAALNTFSMTFEIFPNLLPVNKRPGMMGLGNNIVGR
jgi:hypothetical protein